MGNIADRIARLRVLLLTRPAKIIGVLLLVYGICGFLLAPWLVRQQWPGLVEQQLGAQGSVGSVYINPFLMIFDARDLVIAEKTGAPVLQVGRVLVNFELSSLLRWAWTFSEIRIEQPVLNAELDAKESLNLARLLTPKTAAPDHLLQNHRHCHGCCWSMSPSPVAASVLPTIRCNRRPAPRSVRSILKSTTSRRCPNTAAITHSLPACPAAAACNGRASSACRRWIPADRSR